MYGARRYSYKEDRQAGAERWVGWISIFTLLRPALREASGARPPLRPPLASLPHSLPPPSLRPPSDPARPPAPSPAAPPWVLYCDGVMRSHQLNRMAPVSGCVPGGPPSPSASPCPDMSIGTGSPIRRTTEPWKPRKRKTATALRTGAANVTVSQCPAQGEDGLECLDARPHTKTQGPFPWQHKAGGRVQAGQLTHLRAQDGATDVGAPGCVGVKGVSRRAN